LRLLECSGLNSAGEAFHVRLWLQAHSVAGAGAQHYAVVTGVVEAAVDKGSRTIRDLPGSDGHALLHHGVADHGGLDGHGGGDPGLPVLHGRSQGRGWRKAFLSAHHGGAARGRSALG